MSEPRWHRTTYCPYHDRIEEFADPMVSDDTGRTKWMRATNIDALQHRTPGTGTYMRVRLECGAFKNLVTAFA